MVVLTDSHVIELGCELALFIEHLQILVEGLGVVERLECQVINVIVLLVDCKVVQSVSSTLDTLYSHVGLF